MISVHTEMKNNQCKHKKKYQIKTRQGSLLCNNLLNLNLPLIFLKHQHSHNLKTPKNLRKSKVIKKTLKIYLNNSLSNAIPLLTNSKFLLSNLIGTTTRLPEVISFLTTTNQTQHLKINQISSKTIAWTFLLPLALVPSRMNQLNSNSPSRV